MRKTTLGVIVTLYNKQDYIIRALESLFRQTQLPDELIVVNDCSTDESDSVASAYITEVIEQNELHVIYLSLEENVGAAEARNMALRKAQSDYLLFLDADDQYEKRYIEYLRVILDTLPNVGLIVSKVKMESSGLEYPSSKIDCFFKEGKSEEKFRLIDNPLEILSVESLFVGGGNVCFKKKNMQDELFDPKEKNFEEWNFYYNLLNNTKEIKESIVYNTNVSYIYNDIDEQSLSRKNIKSYQNIVVPALIKRLEKKEEKGYRALLISMWAYNSLYRLSDYKEKIKFIFHFRKVLRSMCVNRYSMGALIGLLFPYSVLNYLKKKYKKNRFAK